MSTLLRRIIILGTALLLVPAQNVVTQNTKPVTVCTQAAFAAFQPLPKLEYECPDDGNDSRGDILKLPERLDAIRNVMTGLAGFTNAAWWRSGVNDLNACGVHGSAGEFTDEEKEKWKSGDYSFDLFGDHQIRLTLIPDPCYQTGYNGSNVYLLVRKNGAVVVSQVLDGYFSRVDNSVGIGFAQLNGQQIVEVATANNMPPTLLSYFFVIDPKTNKAVPKKIFQERGKLTNQISSAMLMDHHGPAELKIVSGNRLAQSFSAYEELYGGSDDSGRRLRRIVYRWNGRFYVRR